MKSNNSISFITKDPKEAANQSFGTVGTDGADSGTVDTNGTIPDVLTDEEAAIVKMMQAEPTVTQKKCKKKQDSLCGRSKD